MVSLDDVTLQVKQMTTQWVQSGGTLLVTLVFLNLFIAGGKTVSMCTCRVSSLTSGWPPEIPNRGTAWRQTPPYWSTTTTSVTIRYSMSVWYTTDKSESRLSLSLTKSAELDTQFLSRTKAKMWAETEEILSLTDCLKCLLLCRRLVRHIITCWQLQQRQKSTFYQKESPAFVAIHSHKLLSRCRR